MGIRRSVLMLLTPALIWGSLSHGAEQQSGMVGLHLGNSNDKTIVVNVLSDYPASKAGLSRYDEIVEVDDKSVAGLGEIVVRDLIRGAAGSVVKIKVMRDGKPLTFTLTRVPSEQSTSSQSEPLAELPPPIASAPPHMKPEAIKWRWDLRSALGESRSSKKLIFLYMTMDG